MENAMAWFRSHDGSLPDIHGGLRDPFAAIPVVPAGVTAQALPSGGLRLTYRPAAQGTVGRLLHRIGLRRERRINLDARGALFWAQLDGHRGLRAIEEHLRKELALQREKSEEATILFTRQLMQRGLILLRIPQRQEIE